MKSYKYDIIIKPEHIEASSAVEIAKILGIGLNSVHKLVHGDKSHVLAKFVTIVRKNKFEQSQSLFQNDTKNKQQEN